MKRASGIGHLKPFLPGLEAVLEDPEVSELMINGPGNVWVERGGELEPHRGARAHRRRALPGGHPHRPAARARSRGAADPRRAARGRLEGRHLHSAGEPPRGDDDPAVRGPRVLGRGPRAAGRPPRDGVPRRPRRAPGSRRNILVSGGTGSGKTTLLNALIELLPRRSVSSPSRTRSSSGSNARTASASRRERPASEAPVSIRDLVAARAPPPARPHRRGRGAGRRGRRSPPGAQHRPRRIAHHRAREQRPLGALAPGQLRHAGRRGAPLGGHLPGRGRRHLHLVVHMTRRAGAALRRGGARGPGLRRGRQPLAHRRPIWPGSTMKNKQDKE